MMNGIDTIIQRLNIDAKAETDALLEKARQEAAAVAARYQAQADKEAADLAARNERLAAEREERLISAAQMEARKTLLTAKQEMVERAYQRALEKLRSLPQEQYVELLAALLVRASSTGRRLSSHRRIGRAPARRLWPGPTSCWPRRPRRSCPSGTAW